jgi:hypothetical protein
VQTAFLGLYSPTFQETKAHNLPIVELTDQSCLEHHCIDKGGICVFVYFDNDRPAETFKLLTTVQQVQRKAQSTGLFSFAYLDTMKAGSREFLSEAFGVTGDGYPKLLIYSAKKGQFHQMVGSFNAKRITTYLRSVQSGNVAAGPVPNKRPKLVQEGVENGVCEADIAQAKLEKKQQQQNPTADSDVSTRSKMRVQRGSGKAGLLIEAEDVEQINTVIDTPSHWMVMFTSEEVLEKEGEQAKLDEFKRCAKGLRGVVTFATFVEDDFTEGKFQPLRDNYASLISDAQQQGQESFVLYFVGGRDKDAMGEGVFLYEGSTNAKDMAKWAKTELVSLGKHIVETVETMDELMEVFRAAPFQPVGLFHSTQDTAPAMLQALATEFDEFMRFVFIPDTSDLSTGDEMNLMEAPSLLIMKGENAGDVPGQPGAYQVRQVFDPYRGPLRFNAIASTYMGLSDPFPRPLTDEETYTQTPFVTTTKAAPPTTEKHAEL